MLDEFDKHFKFLLYSRGLRSIAIIYMTLAAPLYLSALKISVVYIGIIYVGVMLFLALSNFLLGLLGDRFGYKKAMIIGETFPILGGILLFLSGNIYVVILAVVVGGIGGVAGGIRGSFSPGTTALVVSNYPDDKERVRRLSALTKTASVFSIAGALMLISQSYLTHYLGILLAYRALFLAAALLVFFSFVSLTFVSEKPRPRKTTRIMKRSSMDYTIRVILLNSINGAAIGIAIPLLPLLLASAFKIPVQTTSLTIGLIYIPSYLCVAAGSYLAGKFSNRGKILRISILARTSSGILLLLMGALVACEYLGILSEYPLLAAVALLYSMRSTIAGFGNPSIQAMNLKGINNEDYGIASGMQGIATNMAMASSGISGYLAEYLLPAPLIAGGLLQILAGLLYGPLLRTRTEKKKAG